MRRWQKIVAAVIGGIVVVAGIIILVLTQTEFGRERVRLFGLDQLAGKVHGIVRIARVSGNLLIGATLEVPKGLAFLEGDRPDLPEAVRVGETGLDFEPSRFEQHGAGLDQGAFESPPGRFLIDGELTRGWPSGRRRTRGLLGARS